MMTPEEFSKKTKDLGFCFMSKYPNDNASFLQCDSGWLQLIHDLCLELNKAGFNGFVDQIKEKFGGLRFYVSYGTISDEDCKKCEDLIIKYENLSLKTCELCGSEGKVEAPNHWMKTVCQTCLPLWEKSQIQTLKYS